MRQPASTAPFTTATLPLQSCRMGALRLNVGRLGNTKAIHGDGAGFGTNVEADAAARAIHAGVPRRMNTIGIQSRQQFEAVGRAGVHANATAFAFFLVDGDFASGGGHGSPFLKRGPLQPARLFAIRIQFLSEVGMSDFDKGFGTLANGLAVKVGDAEFCDYVVDGAARCDYPSAGIEHGDDAGKGAALGCGVNRDNRFATLALRSAADKVDLSANAAVKSCADGISADLAGDIDLQCRVDSDHFVVLRDDPGIVGVFVGVKLEHGVVVDEVEELFASEDESEDDFSSVNGLAVSVDDAGFDQGDGAVAQHFGLHAEVAMVGEFKQHGVRNAADSELQGAAVLDEAGNVLSDSVVDISNRNGPEFAERAGDFDGGVDFADVKEAIAEGAGNLIIALGYDQLCATGCRQRGVNANAEAAKAVSIGGRDLH